MKSEHDQVKILIVDDDTAVGVVAARLLEDNGYSTHCVTNSETALADLKDGKVYDIVLTDIRMPGTPGTELAVKIHEMFPSCDVIVMTGVPTLESAVEVIRAGAFDYIIKPFSQETLILAIEKCVRKRQLSAELKTEKALRAELEASNFQLKSLERMKDSFLAVIGHELRTPLTLILGALDLAERDPARQIPPALFGGMKQGAARLREVIEDLILYTGMNREKALSRKEKLDLNEAVRTSVQRLSERIKKSGLSMELALSGGNAMVEADSGMLHAAIRHLLLNALSFNKPNGKIRVETLREGSIMRLRVDDTGDGIPPEHLRSICDPFYQAADYLTRRTGGLGLGLAIIRKMAELHGGKVEVKSEPGKGSSFSILLPGQTS
ncbi:MAG: hypothetical protein A2X28_07770 [Elusimicrobia bacterium GWA2_56_46]|nr:MAG: hypothetical protein A2X28_07770 [Elusimicrobia bacterium GWA2_56_46]OGR53785.1 MAG: hypothetical protein A2X39_06660 [Elusimicrobia bacterium GWC2_56_31]HBB68020.1 hypothetical protein [Elusimicrobiota bacterium]HBW22637.1 hypothetical protein [Elusimicrobiota bacterium]